MEARHHVFRRHYSEIYEKLATSPDDLLSLTAKFYQEGFINRLTKADINDKGAVKGAEALLSHVESSVGVESDDDRNLPRIIQIFGDAVALKEIAHKMKYIVKMNNGRGFDVGIVPKWCYQELCCLDYEIQPAYRTIEHFTKRKENHELCSTSPFLTSSEGYKMVLGVYPSGYCSGEDTHVSVFLKLITGPNDSQLPFPIPDMTFSVQLLNWKDNCDHIDKIIVFNEDTPLESRQQCISVMDGMTTASNELHWVGHEKFLSHDDLCNDSPYIDGEKITFKVWLHFNSPSGNDQEQLPNTLLPPSCTYTSSPLTSQQQVDRTAATKLANHDQQKIESENLKVDVSETIHDSLKSLNKKYKDLTFKLQKHINELVNDQLVDLNLDDLKDRLEMEAEFYESCNIAEVTCVKQIFKKLISPDCCCFFLEPDILVIIADFLEDYNPEFHSKVMSYVDDVNVFKKTEPLANLKSKIRPLIGLHCSGLREGTVKIKFRLQNALGKIPMELFEALLTKSIYPKMTYKWYEVENGSIIVVIFTPKKFAKPFIECCQVEQAEFLPLVGVFDICVDDVAIISNDDIEKPGYSFESSLLKATNLGNMKAIKFLIKACTYTGHGKKSHSENALIVATEHLNIEAVKCFINANHSVNIYNTDNKKSPLIIACERGCNELAELLLDAKADVNHKDSDGNTALHHTCIHKYVQVSLALVKFAADPLITNSKGETPFLLAVGENSYEVVNSFIPKVSSQSAQLCSAFLLACKHGYSSIIACLVDSLKLKHNLDFSLAVMFAQGDISSVSLLPNESLHSPMYKGVTPLMIASSCGNVEVISFLIEAKVNINCSDDEGHTPLVYAANGCKSLEVMDQLLRAKSNPFVKIGNLHLIHDQLIAYKSDEVKKKQVLLLLQYAALYLHELFTSLVKQLKTDITQNVLKRKQSVHDYLHKIKTSEHAFNYIPGLLSADNCDQLFACIQPFYDFLSWKLISSLSNCLKEKYLKLVCVFETSTKLYMFNNVTTLISPSLSPANSDTTSLQIELDKEWKNKALIDLRRVAHYLLTIDSDHAVDVALSCLAITTSQNEVLVEYRMPKSLELAEKITQLVGKLRVSAMILGVVKIVINGVCVPKIDKCHSFEFESSLLNAIMNSEQMNYKEFPKLLKLLLKNLKIDPDFKAAGTTAMLYAIENANLEAVNLLIEANASLYLEDDLGVSPLSLASSLASSEKHIEVIKALYKKVTTIDCKSDGCRKKNLDHFIDEIRSKIDPRHLVSSFEIQSADESQLSRSALRTHGRALINACDYGAIEEVKNLLEKGVDPNALNEIAPFTALMLASFRGHTEIVKVLLRHNADHSCLRISKEGLPFFDAFALACYSGNFETVNAYFNEAISLHPRQLYFGWYISCLYNRSKIAEQLLEYLADLSVEQRELIEACIHNDVNHIKNVDAGIATAQIPIMFGITPLMIACSCDSFEVAKVLLQVHGSRSDEEDNFGFQPCTFCDYESPILILVDRNDPRFDPFIDKNMICLEPHSEPGDDID